MTKDNPELLAPVDFNDIRLLTSRMQQMISSGTIDSPSWELVRIAKLANRMYAPLGTRMTLGDYVRGIRCFLDALKPPEPLKSDAPAGNGKIDNDDTMDPAKNRANLRNDLKVRIPLYPRGPAVIPPIDIPR